MGVDAIPSLILVIVVFAHVDWRPKRVFGSSGRISRLREDESAGSINDHSQAQGQEDELMMHE